MQLLKLKRSVVREQAAILADRIVQDIAQRKLKYGDRYLTTAMAAQQFHVRQTTVNLAMRILAERGVLVRRVRSGTFVGRSTTGAEVQVKALYVVESADMLSHYPPLYETIGLIRSRLPGLGIHLYTVPVHGALDYVCELMSHARSTGNAVGFLLISCPREVYRYFTESEIPSVVLSEVFSESDSLTTMSGDQQLAGRLLADHVLNAGHKRIALFTHANWRAGDNRFLEGINQALETAHLPHGALIVRSLPDNHDEWTYHAAELWSAEDGPTAFICRMHAQAECIARATAGVSANNKSRPEIVFGVATGRLPENCPFPYALEQDLASQINRALDVLAEVSSLPGIQGQHIRLPIELVLPHRGREREAE